MTQALRPRHGRWHSWASRTTIAALMSVPALPSMAGDIDLITMFRNLSFAQTGDGNTLSDNGSFLSTTVFTLGGDVYSSVSVAFPGPTSPLSLLPSR